MLTNALVRAVLVLVILPFAVLAYGALLVSIDTEPKPTTLKDVGLNLMLPIATILLGIVLLVRIVTI